MPCPHDEVPIFRDRTQDIRKVARIEAITVGDRYLRLKPDLCIPTAAFDVNM